VSAVDGATLDGGAVTVDGGDDDFDAAGEPQLQPPHPFIHHPPSSYPVATPPFPLPSGHGLLYVAPALGSAARARSLPGSDG
jgi:hypothetical protein